ncbi:MAG: transposase [Moorea sp. SIO3I8]|nr:transposase [Moorena sp. SIO3I8]
MCHLSKNMFNVGLYNVRQYFFQERKHLRYESNYYHSKENENYKLLPTDIAQQTLKIVDISFKSFFGLIKLKSSGGYQEKVRIPNYLPKDGHFILGLLLVANLPFHPLFPAPKSLLPKT